jgi:hypothetical protein
VQLARYDLGDSPLWQTAEQHSMWGRLVVDPDEVEQIRRRVEFYRRPRPARWLFHAGGAR